MAKIELTTQVIKELAKILNDTELGAISVKNDDFTIELQAQEKNIVVSNTLSPSAEVSCTAPAPAAADNAAEQPMRGNVVESPIIGTFYAAPAPDKEPFARVGQSVKKGDVLFIIESMKLMNEVTSDFDGIIKKICVENAAPVEYGQRIMIIE